MTDTSRQVSAKYRGIVLPEGMTPQCLDALAALFNDFADDLLDIPEEISSSVQAAVMAYSIVTKECQLEAKI